MTQKEIQDLIKLVAKTELAEFKFKTDDFTLHIRGKSDVPVISQAAPPSVISMPASAPPAAVNPVATTSPGVNTSNNEEAKESNNYLEIKSPMIGTFYRSSSPDKDAYVKVGDKVSRGDTVCIVEAMKLFNEIESEVSGTIVKVLVEDAQPIEYDQPLFLVDPS